jgi:hypothetical protein
MSSVITDAFNDAIACVLRERIVERPPFVRAREPSSYLSLNED